MSKGKPAALSLPELQRTPALSTRSSGTLLLTMQRSRRWSNWNPVLSHLRPSSAGAGGRGSFAKNYVAPLWIRPLSWTSVPNDRQPTSLTFVLLAWTSVSMTFRRSGNSRLGFPSAKRVRATERTHYLPSCSQLTLDSSLPRSTSSLSSRSCDSRSLSPSKVVCLQNF